MSDFIFSYRNLESETHTPNRGNTGHQICKLTKILLLLFLDQRKNVVKNGKASTADRSSTQNRFQSRNITEHNPSPSKFRKTAESSAVNLFQKLTSNYFN